MTNPTIIIDLDGVIAGPKPENGDYSQCTVNLPLVKRLRELAKQGWEITIHTSRQMRTYHGDLGKIISNTVPVICDWLNKHDVPFNSIVPGKPWPGPMGFYVDDRAVTPQEFLELTAEELTKRTNGAFYNPAKPNWRAGSEQSWIVIDLRQNLSTLFSEVLVEWIKECRELGGRRCVLVLPPSVQITVGYDEELKRLGARIFRWDKTQALDKIKSIIKRELVLEGVMSPTSELEPGRFSHDYSGHLSSRHFNTVYAHGDQVVKSSSNEEKVHFERMWLEEAININPDVIINGVEVRCNGYGYTMDRAAGGPLSNILLRRPLEPYEGLFICQELERVWDGLSYVAKTHTPREHHTNSPVRDLANEHEELIVRKTRKRQQELGKVGKRLGFDLETVWTVNGEKIGSIHSVIDEMLALIPVQKQEHRGIFHGDLCPGNLVFTEVFDEDTTKLVAIDPRGTIDGTKVALFGDRRYDLAKLAHALRWGYDAIVAGWRDIAYSAEPGTFNVHLRLWDEDAGITPNRLLAWDQLIENNFIKAGSVTLDAVEVHAITALQLMTCAPLHIDDPERALALITRGLQVAAYAKAKNN